MKKKKVIPGNCLQMKAPIHFTLTAYLGINYADNQIVTGIFIALLGIYWLVWIMNLAYGDPIDPFEYFEQKYNKNTEQNTERHFWKSRNI